MTARALREEAFRLAWINNHDERIDAITAALVQRARLDEAEDFRHDMALQAYCAPDADFDTIRESLSARIADLAATDRAVEAYREVARLLHDACESDARVRDWATARADALEAERDQ